MKRGFNLQRKNNTNTENKMKKILGLLNDKIIISEEILEAIKDNKPIVSLESTIITHGLPYPVNIEVAYKCQQIIRENGAVPATIGIINGIPKIGISDDEIEFLSTNSQSCFKSSTKDIGYCYSKKLNAGTTVAATLFLSSLVGIECFATGGIGGVHRNAEKTFDISADIHALSNYTGIVVCAGCKSILDIPKTIEILETYEITVLGFNTNQFPAFYSRNSGYNIQLEVNDENQIAQCYIFNKSLNFNSTILVVNPIPEEDEIPIEKISNLIDEAIAESIEKDICGKDVTPFLLERLSSLSKGQTLNANKSLIYNNVKLASNISKNLKKLKDNL